MTTPFDPTSRSGGPLIEVANAWGNPHVQADRLRAAGGGRVATYQDISRGQDPSPHWLPQEAFQRMWERRDASMPRLASSGSATPGELEKFFGKLLPKGATFDPGAGGSFAAARNGRRTADSSSSTGVGGTFFTAQRPYLPEFESPDRQNYPVHRCLLEGTLVQYASGRVGPIESVRAGDTLLGPDGCPRRVLSVWTDGSPERLVEIHWSNGHVVRCTSEHTWPTTRGNVRAAELVRDDICFIVHKCPAGTPATAALADCYAAEGNIAYNGKESANGHDLAHVKVQRIEIIDNTERRPVYDLTVSGDHRYCLAGGLVTHNSLANTHFRMFYRMDGAIGTGVEMISDLVFGDFKLSGEGVDGSVKSGFEASIEACQLPALMKFFLSEYLVVGEVAPHLFYDNDEGMWTHLAFHNPDHLEVIDAPFAFGKHPPIVRYQPDDRLRQMLTLAATSPQIEAIRAAMPDELIAAIMGRQHIELSPVNFTFIPRKLFPYDTRGTSIISRLWRDLMYEDSLYSASIAIARRAAAPLKVAKTGDAASGWIPSPEQDQRLLELLVQSESDPAAWLCFVEGTPVVMADGTEKPIEDIKVGDEVLDADGRPQVVDRAWREGTPPEVVEIALVGKIKIRATMNHEWPVWMWPRSCACGCDQEVQPGRSFANGHNDRRREADNELVPAFEHDAQIIAAGRSTFVRRLPRAWQPYQDLTSSQLRAGDYLLSPRGFKTRIPDGVTEVHAELLGLYAVEGHVQDNYLDYGTTPSGEIRSVHWSFGYHERDTLAAETVALCTQLGLPARLAVSEEHSHAIVSVSQKEHAHFAQWCFTHAGKYSHEKRLSRDVIEWPQNLKIAFLRGLYRGDGSQSLVHGGRRKRPQLLVQHTTASRYLATQVRTLLTQIGCGSACRVCIRKKCCHGHPLYRLPAPDLPGECEHGHKMSVHYLTQCTGRDARRLADLLWQDTSLASQDMPTERFAQPTYEVTNKHVFRLVRRVRVVPNSKPVYNITVRNSHTYQVCGVATHNCWNFGVQFELVGSQERTWKVEQTGEYIERKKLEALGISKSFLWGEVSYASTAGALTVFLQRLKAARTFFEKTWLLPKFFRQMAEMNEWYLPTPAELAHRVRTKRSWREMQGRLIVPTVEWERALDPAIDQSKIEAIRALEGIGVRFSDQTKVALAGKDWEKEFRQAITEAETKSTLLTELAKKNPAAAQLLAPAGGENGGGGGGGGLGGVLPPVMPPSDEGLGAGGESLPPGGPGEPPPGGPGPGPTPEGAAGGGGGSGVHAEPTTPGTGGPTGITWAEGGRYGNWPRSVVEDLIQVLRGETAAQHAEEPWPELFRGDTALDAAVTGGDPHGAVELLEDGLLAHGYTVRDVRDLRTLLTAYGIPVTPRGV
mgnify:FL=1